MSESSGLAEKPAALDSVCGTPGILSLGRRAWRQLSRRRRAQLNLLVALMIVASIVEVFSIGAVVPFLSVLSSPSVAFEHELIRSVVRPFGVSTPAGLLLPVTLLFAGAALLSGIGRYGLLVAQTRVTYAIGVDLSVRIFERTLYEPYLVHLRRNSSDVLASVSNRANDIIVSLLYPLVVMVSSILMLVVVIGALIIMAPLITLATVGAFTVFYGITSWVSHRQLRDSGRIINKQYSNVIRLIQEGLGGIRDILLDGTQRTFVRHYRASETELRTSRATVQIVSGTPRFTIETLGTLFLAGLAYAFASHAHGISAAIPVLGVVALAAQRLIPVAQQLYSSWASIAGGSASVHEALAFLEEMEPRLGGDQDVDAMPFGSRIELRDVSFSYAPDLPPVLNKVSLTIPRGARVGVIGTTGSGKSTLLDLVMGLLPPTGGVLSVDGRVLDESNIRSWQKNIAHVPQDIFLADASVTENIAFGQGPSEIDMERVVAAARTAQVWDDIQALPRGASTRVGERGARLSGGQRQRIGIARALYKQAGVIILDEATSALDSQTERRVMDAVHDLPGSPTVLIVTHRHSTLQNCSFIVRITRAGGLETGADVEAFGGDNRIMERAAHP